MYCKNISTKILNAPLNKVNSFLNIIVVKLPGLIFEKVYLFSKKETKKKKKKKFLNLYTH